MDCTDCVGNLPLAIFIMLSLITVILILYIVISYMMGSRSGETSRRRVPKYRIPTPTRELPKTTNEPIMIDLSKIKTIDELESNRRALVVLSSNSNLNEDVSEPNKHYLGEISK